MLLSKGIFGGKGMLKKSSNSTILKCDVCNSKKSEPFQKIGNHTYVRCQKCGTIYLVTRHLNLEGKDDITYLEDPEAYLSIINPEGTRYMAGSIDHAYNTKIGRPKGKLLEIGSGLGHLSYTLYSRDWDVHSLELSDKAVDWSSKVFKLPVEATKIEDYFDDSFDAFVMVEVLEHLYNPLQALKKITDLGSRKSLIFGTTPNTASKHWPTVKTKVYRPDIYIPDDHIVLFNKESLHKLLAKAKFKDITIEYFGVGDKNDSNLMFSAVIK